MSRRLLLLLVLLLPIPTFAQQSSTPIFRPQKPPLFGYGAFQGKYKSEAGELLLDAPNGKGGLGYNLQPNLNIAEHADKSLALRVLIRPENKLKSFRIMLSDAAGSTASWNFSLENKPLGTSTVLIPTGAAPLTLPNVPGKGGPLNLSAISQFQLQGDWGNNPAAVTVQSLEVATPDGEMKALRAEAAKIVEAAAAKLREERAAQEAKYCPGTPLSPTLTRLSAVATDVLDLEIQSFKIALGRQEKYVKQDGDTTREKKKSNGTLETLTLIRNGKEYGRLVGPNREWLTVLPTSSGDPLLTWLAESPENYQLSSPDDPNYVAPTQPLVLGRKATPTYWAEGTHDCEISHHIYLRLPKPLKPGANYTLKLGRLNTRQPETAFRFDPSTLRSEAVHVHQIGYRPDDPAKRAFVSQWLGTGGPMKLPAALDFSLVDAKTNAVVYKGRSQDLWPADKNEVNRRNVNFTGSDVMRLDFSSFKTPGQYRVAVEGLGCSYPFTIGPDVWRNAFQIQMRGLYHQRSGIELGPPYTDFKKPRDMFPGDPGVSVTWTKNRGVQKGSMDNLAAGDTGEPANGWGGYHDAGDWNPRRVTHMAATMAQLEVFDLFPDYFRPMKLNIPARPGVPDILTEAIFEFETFHRLQQPSGGVGYGLETQGDPLPAETSWLQSFKIYALSPDYSASWYYATVGARLAYLLQPFDPKLSAEYQASAIAAFNFAEKDFAEDKPNIEAQKRGTWKDTDQRNFAALELYRLTKDDRWHQIFLQDTALTQDKPNINWYGKHVQRDQAFLYARLPANLGDPALKVKAKAAVEDIAQRSLDYARNNAFNLTTPDKNRPEFLGFFGVPDAVDLVHAHFLTGDPQYLAGAVQSTQFQSGCNPNNLVYTTGLGANPVKNTFKLDARITGQPTPVGLTAFGNIDFAQPLMNQAFITWPAQYVLNKVIVPEPFAYPVNEAYWDIGGWHALNEFVVDTWAPNIAIWGYLAARATTPQ